MACPSLISPACELGEEVAGAAASGAMERIAETIQDGVAWVVSNTVAWWVKVPSPDLTGETAVTRLQQWMLPFAAAVAVVAMIAAGGKMALTRKANPLVDVGSGLLIIIATSAIGVLLPSMLLKAGDSWSTWVLNASTGDQFGERLTTVLMLPGASPGVVIVLGIVAIVMAAVQAVLMLFRQAALVVLAGVLPLAAAGTLAPMTRSWFRRIAGWMLALIFYKPAAAAVYATAFTMIGSGDDPRTILMGFTMVLLSLVALPALLKFFTWAAGAVESQAGGGSGLMGAAMGGAVAAGALRSSAGGSGGGSGGSSAVDHARYMSAQLGQQDHGGAGPTGSSAGSPPSGPTPSPSGTATKATTGPGTSAAGGTASTAARAGSATGGGAAGAGSAAAAGPPGAAAAGVAAAQKAGHAGKAGVRLASGSMQPPSEENRR